MTLTIDLTPTEEADLTSAARQAGLDPAALVKPLTIQMPLSEMISVTSQEGYEAWVKHFLLQAFSPQGQTVAVSHDDPASDDLHETLPQAEERFRGIVERVGNGIAYLSLTDTQGARSFASYNAEQLALLDIREGSAFTCRLTVRRNKAELVFQPVRTVALSDEELSRLWEPIDAVLGDYDAKDDE